MKQIALSTLLMLAPSFSFAGQVAQDAKAIEAQMNAVSPDFNNPAVADISINATIFVHKALSGKGALDEADYRAVARVIVRAQGYDGPGDMQECNTALVQKHRAGLKIAVAGLRVGRGIRAEDLTPARTYIENGEDDSGEICGIVRALSSNGGNKSGKKAAAPAKKTGGIMAWFRKPQAAQEEGAGLSKHVNASPAWSADRRPVVVKQLERVQDKTFSSFDPTVGR